LTVDNVGIRKNVVFKTTYEGATRERNIAVGVILNAEILWSHQSSAQLVNIKVQWDNGNVHNYDADQLLIDARNELFRQLISNKKSDPNKAFRRESHDRRFQRGIRIPE